MAEIYFAVLLLGMEILLPSQIAIPCLVLLELGNTMGPGLPWGFPMQPAPVPVKTHAHSHGCGFPRARVMGSLKPMGTHGVFYL